MPAVQRSVPQGTQTHLGQAPDEVRDKRVTPIDVQGHVVRPLLIGIVAGSTHGAHRRIVNAGGSHRLAERVIHTKREIVAIASVE